LTKPPNPPGPHAGVQGITEDDIANYLAHTPGFFDRHAELLATVQLTSPHGQRAVSLQERQMEMLRERIKGLEGRIVEMIRASQDNMVIADRLVRWARSMLLTVEASALPRSLLADLRHRFMVPQAALRVWGVLPEFAGLDVAAGVTDDMRRFATSLTQPYCGVNNGFEAVQWLEQPAAALSVAMMPLRAPDETEAFGLLILASPDAARYSADMGTEFLGRIGELASAGLCRLLPQG
jgi:uncharacterized protein